MEQGGEWGMKGSEGETDHVKRVSTLSQRQWNDSNWLLENLKL